MSDAKPQIREAQTTPSGIRQKRTKNLAPVRIILELQKTEGKETHLKEVRGEKSLTYRGAKMRIISDVSEVMQAKGE